MRQGLGRSFPKAGVVAVGLVLLTGTWAPAQAGVALDVTKLTSVCLFGEKPPIEAVSDHGLNREAVLNFAYVTLKSKLPRLQVERMPCGEPTLYVNVHLYTNKAGAGTKLGYYGMITVLLTRNTLWLTGQAGLGIAYSGDMVLSGPMGSAYQHLNEAIDRLLTDFAAEYYKAGNP